MPEISANVSYALAVFFALIFTLGVSLNGLVVLTYVRYRKKLLTHARDVFILCIAIGDFFLTVSVCPLSLSSSVAGKWLWGRGGCIWYGFITTCSSLAAVCEITALAFVSYITIRSSTPNPVSTRRAFQAVLCSWLLGILSSCFPIIGWSEYTFEAFGLHCSINWDLITLGNLTYSAYLLIIFYLLPVSIIVFSYTKIFFLIRRVYFQAEERWGPTADVTKDTYQGQVKVAKQLMVTILGFMVVWTPYAVISTLVLAFGTDISHGFREYPAMFAKLSVVVNPVLYFFTHRKLRAQAFETLKWVKCTLCGKVTKGEMPGARSEYELQNLEQRL